MLPGLRPCNSPRHWRGSHSIASRGQASPAGGGRATFHALPPQILRPDEGLLSAEIHHCPGRNPPQVLGPDGSDRCRPRLSPEPVISENCARRSRLVVLPASSEITSTPKYVGSEPSAPSGPPVLIWDGLSSPNPHRTLWDLIETTHAQVPDTLLSPYPAHCLGSSPQVEGSFSTGRT